MSFSMSDSINNNLNNNNGETHGLGNEERKNLLQNFNGSPMVAIEVSCNRFRLLEEVGS